MQQHERNEEEEKGKHVSGTLQLAAQGLKETKIDVARLSRAENERLVLDELEQSSHRSAKFETFYAPTRLFD